MIDPTTLRTMSKRSYHGATSHTHFSVYVHLMQGSNLTVARSPLATENDNEPLKTHNKFARMALDVFFFFFFFFLNQ